MTKNYNFAQWYLLSKMAGILTSLLAEIKARFAAQRGRRGRHEKYNYWNLASHFIRFIMDDPSEYEKYLVLLSKCGSDFLSSLFVRRPSSVDNFHILKSVCFIFSFWNLFRVDQYIIYMIMHTTKARMIF